MPIEKSLTVTFKAEDEAKTTYLRMDSDTDRNVDEDGNALTTFLPGSKAYVRVYGEGYTIDSSAGFISSEGFGTREITETVKFHNSKTATLSYLPSGSVTYSWTGNNCGTPTRNGMTLSLSSECIGVLECIYDIAFDRYAVYFAEEGAVTVVANLEIEGLDDLNAYVDFTFADAATTLETDLSLILDNDKNDDETTFGVGDWVYLLCFHANDAERTYISSNGSVSRVAQDAAVDIEDEVVNFQNTSTGILAYLPIHSVSYVWSGISFGEYPNNVFPIFDGRTITLKEKALGTLTCTYKTKADRVRLSAVNILGSTFVLVTQTIESEETGENGETGEFTEYSSVCEVIFEDVTGTDEPIPYDLNIKDFCSSSDIEGVEVIWDGVNIGVTDSSGVIYLGLQAPRSTHTLKMVKTGYIPSDEDNLNNDSVTIPPRGIV